MDRFDPPKRPAGFEKRVRPLRTAIGKAFAPGGDRKPEFTDAWGDFKAPLSEATLGKCGYCEVFVISGQHGDVEHFYPKSEIWKLSDDAAERGEQEDWTARVRGRKQDILSESGFWWMAYDWKNYLLSCLVCNQKWKLAYFPFKGRPTLPPRRRSRYRPLLLNPFTGLDPREHLEFGPDGEVTPRMGSPEGQATIDVCGLDRTNLRKKRLEKAKRAHALVSQLLKADVPSAEFDRIAQEIYDAGDQKYEHSGLVKTVLHQFGGLKWSQLKEIVADIRGT